MGRKVRIKKSSGIFDDLASAVTVATTVPKGRDRSHDVPIPASKAKEIAAETARRKEQREREERQRREEAHREEKRAKGQAKVWAAEQTIDPLGYLLTPTRKTREPEAIAPYRPGMAPGQQAAARRAARDEKRRRRQAAKLGSLLLSAAERKRYPVIGRDPSRFLVETMDPTRRRQLEERAVPRGTPPKERRTPTERETQAAGFMGRPGERLGQAGSLFGEIWGDVKDIGTGIYGTGVDYGEALYADIRHPELTKGPLSRTGELVARDVVGTIGAYEAAIPEPSWLPDWMKKSGPTGKLEFGWEVDPTDPERAKQAWTHDPLLSALLFVPVVGGVTRAASVGTLRRSIRQANPGLSAKEVNRLARKESRMPGYAAAQGHAGGIKPRMVGAPKTTVEATAGAVYEGAKGTLRYPEKGKPGYEFLTTKGAADAVFRDTDGVVRGYARATDGGSLKTWIDPDHRRRGIATNLYETLMKNGIDVDALSGVGPMTPEGQALAASRGRVVGRPYSRTPTGRGVQRGYDFASDLIERYLGPNAKELSRLGRAGRQVAGRWGTSRRGTRMVERNQRKDVARQGAIIARHEREIARGASKPELQQALIAALEAPETISIRDAVEIKIRHLSSLETPENRLAIQGQISQLQKALHGKDIDSPDFQRALDSTVALSKRAEELAKTVMGLSDDALRDRRNRVMFAWQAAGLLDEGVGNARGWFPHRGMNEIVPSSMTPTGVAATGRTVGVPRPTRALETRQNRLALYERGAVNTNPKVLADTLRGRVRYQKSQEGRRYLYNQGAPIVAGAEIPEEGFYFVRNPDATAATIPADVRAILEHPQRFTAGDEAALRQWANQWIRPAGDGLPSEWSSSLDNVRLVPAGNVHTALGDAFSSAPRGNTAAVAALLNSAVRTSLIYAPFLGSRYVIRNTAQNVVLMALTRPTAFRKLGTAVRGLRSKDKALWDAIQVETGTIQAAGGLPETAIRGVRGAQRAERWTTEKSRQVSGLLGAVADEPFRVASWLSYADAYGFKGPARWKELLNSDDPAIARVRDDIGQAVRDDLIDFDTLTPGERESISRFVFIYPFTKGIAKWPVTYMRDHQTRAAIIGLIASQHEREGAEWGELMVGGRMTNLSWLSPIAPVQEMAANALEVGQAMKEGRFDWSSAANILSPTYQDIIESGGRGGMSLERLAETWVPGFSTYRNVAPEDLPFARGDDFTEKVGRFLGTRAWRWQQSTAGKAALWGSTVAEIYGTVPEGLVEAKAGKDDYESATRGKSEREKVQWLADFYASIHPEMESHRGRWAEAIEAEDADGLDEWKKEFVAELAWEEVSAIDSRIAVIEDAMEYLDKHPASAAQRENWIAAIGNASDEELAEWRKELAGEVG